MFVWHRQGIFSKWHTVVVLFYPRKISLNIAYLCSDQAWLNFSHLFLVLLGLLTHTLLGNIWIEPQPPYPPNLDHIPSLCSTLRKCEQHRKMWLFVTPSRLVFDFPWGRACVPLVFSLEEISRGWEELWGSKCCEYIVHWGEHMAIVIEDQYGMSLRAKSCIKNNFQTLFLHFGSPPLLHNRAH